MSNKPTSGLPERPKPFTDYDFSLVRGVLETTALTIDPVEEWCKEAAAWMDAAETLITKLQGEVERLEESMGMAAMRRKDEQIATLTERLRVAEGEFRKIEDYADWNDDDAECLQDSLHACWNCATRAIRSLNTGSECEHEWIDARNPAIVGGEYCPKCHAVRPTQPSDHTGGEDE